MGGGVAVGQRGPAGRRGLGQWQHARNGDVGVTSLTADELPHARTLSAPSPQYRVITTRRIPIEWMGGRRSKGESLPPFHRHYYIYRSLLRFFPPHTISPRPTFRVFDVSRMCCILYTMSFVIYFYFLITIFHYCLDVYFLFV